MKKVLGFFTVFSVLGLCIKYYFANKITLELAGFFIIGSVILAAMDRPVWQFVKVGVALVSIVLLLANYAYSTNDMISLIQPILILLVALFGIYIMVRGFFRKDDDEIHLTINPKTGKVKKRGW
jgi:hypothetical protein